MNILLVHSYKGGSGKTTISLNGARSLAEEKKVLLIEADFKMPSFSHLFSSRNVSCYFNDYLNGTNKLTETIDRVTLHDENVHLIYANPKFVPKDKIHSSKRSWFITMRDNLFEDLKHLDYDIVIFDLGPGVNFFTLAILTVANGLLDVVRPDFQSFRGIEFLIENFYKKAISSTNVKFNIVFNQVPSHPKMTTLLNEWIQKLKIRHNGISNIWKLDYDDEVAYRSAIQEIILPKGNSVMLKLNKIFRSLV